MPKRIHMHLFVLSGMHSYHQDIAVCCVPSTSFFWSCCAGISTHHLDYIRDTLFRWQRAKASCYGPKSFAQSFVQGLLTWRLMPVDSTVNEYLVITAEHTSFLQVLLAPMGHIFQGGTLNSVKPYLLLLLTPCTVVIDLLKSFCRVLPLGSYILSETSVLLSLLHSQLKILPVVPENNLDSDGRLHRSMILKGMSCDKQRINHSIWSWWSEHCSHISVSPKKGNTYAFMNSSLNNLGRLSGGISLYHHTADRETITIMAVKVRALSGRKLLSAQLVAVQLSLQVGWWSVVVAKDTGQFMHLHIC